MLHRLVYFHCNYIEKWLIIMLSYLKLLLAALHGTSVKGSSSDRTLQVPLNYSNNRNVPRHHLSTKLILDNMFTYTHSLLTSKSIPNQHLFIVICLCACSYHVLHTVCLVTLMLFIIIIVYSGRID